MQFRSEVRNFALEVNESGAADGKKHLHSDRRPLLKACDALRRDLAPLGVHVKVSTFNSSTGMSSIFRNIFCVLILLILTMAKTVVSAGQSQSLFSRTSSYS